MLKLFQIPIVFGVLFSVMALSSCSDPSDKTKPRFDPLIHVWPHDLVALDPDPAVRYGRLNNGMRYAITQNSLPKQEAAIRFWIKAGALHEQDDELGTAHFLEHMAFNGSENIPEGDLVKSLERLGLQFGADSNASVSFSRTMYKLNLPNVDDETVDYALLVLREFSDKLLIETDAVDRERGVVLAEENRSNNAFRKAQRIANAFFYKDHLQIRRPNIGTPESLQTIDADMLRAFYENYYRPERSFLVIAGDFDVDLIEQKIIEVFSNWNSNGSAPAEPDLSAALEKRAVEGRVYNDPKINDSLLMFSSIESTSGAPTEAYQLRRFHEIIATTIVNRRIAKTTLKPDSPIRYGSVAYYVKAQGDQRIARGTPKDKDWHAVIEILQEEIKTALEFGFQKAEYDEVVADLRRAARDASNNMDKRKSTQIADGILGQFSGGRVATSPTKNLEMMDRHITTTEIADIDSAFRRIYANFEPQIWLQGKDYDDVSDQDLVKAFKEVNLRKANPPETREKKEFAYQLFGSAGKIVDRQFREDFEVESLKFDNNVRLNLKKTDFKKDWINIVVNMGEGSYIVPTEERELISLGRSFSWGGFQDHPVSDIKEIFAGKNVNTRLFLNDRFFSFFSALNPEDLEDQLKVWTAMTTAPGYRPEWKIKYDEGRKAYFQTKDSTPGGVARQHVSKIWANDDERFGVLPLKRYLDAQPDAFKAIFQTEFENGAIEIGIVGDYDREQIIAAVAKTFGALPARRPEFLYSSVKNSRVFPEPNRVELFHKGERNQGAIYLAWPFDDKWDFEKMNKFEFIRRILLNRMRETIREDLGISYAPSVGLTYPEHVSGYGYFSTSIKCNPEFFAQYEAAAKSIVADMKTGDITPDEVERVRKPALEKNERSQKENANWVGAVTTAHSRPEILDRRKGTELFLKTLSADDLNKLSQNLFDPNRLHTITITAENKSSE